MTLLDTHVLVWLMEGQKDLGKNARSAADQALAQNDLFVSAITFWEITMLAFKGRLRLNQPPEAWRRDILKLGLAEIPVCGEIGIAAATLPDFHADPADRIIAATASLKNAVLITADARILRWGGPLHSLDARS